MPGANFQMMLSKGGAASASVTYESTATDETDQTTYTFSNQAIGSANSNRYVIVCFHAVFTTSTSLSSATIGGVSATISVQVNSSLSAGGYWASGIIIAAVPTGTTADVVLTFGATAVRASISTFSATGLNSATATNTYTATGSTLSRSIDVSAGGFAVGCTCQYATSGLSTWTWVGLTESTDAQLASGTAQSYSAAAAAFAGAQSGLTVSATPSTAPTATEHSMAIAAFR